MPGTAGTDALHAPRLRDPQHDQALQTLGYATMPLFDAAAVRRLLDVRAALVGPETGITFDTIRTDREPIRAFTEAAGAEWDRVVDDVFVDHRVVFSACVVKAPDEASGMEPQDDRTVVDERVHRALTVWVPLVDATLADDNGWIGVVPGSHLVADAFAGSDIPTWYAPYRDLLAERLVPVPAVAGQAVVWDSRVVHGSPPNRSAAPRPALVATLVPRDAELVHVQAVGRSARRMLRVDDEFHLLHSPLEIRRSMPDYPEIERFSEPVPVVAPAEVAELLGLDGEVVPQADRPGEDPFAAGTRTSPRPADLVAGVDAAVLGAVEDLVAGHLAAGAPSAGLPAEAPAWWPLADPSASGLDLTGPEAVGSGELGGLDQVVATLAPGATVVVGAPDPEATLVYVPLVMPTGRAGVVWADGAAPAELGLPVAAPGAPHAVWNESPDPVRLLVVRPRPPASARRRWWSRPR